jgi:hypothetical protein
VDPEVSETCGAEDYGYQIDPDDEPYRLGPCVLPAGHYPETMHEAPQEWPGHPGVKIPNVRWSERQGHSPKVVQGQAGAFDFVPPTSSGLLKLSELVQEGRYQLTTGSNGLSINCTECGVSDSQDWLDGYPVCLDPVVVLEYIEEHEYEFHQPQDLKVQIPLTQIMTAYAQQAGKTPEEMFPVQFEHSADFQEEARRQYDEYQQSLPEDTREKGAYSIAVPASPYGGVDPSTWDGTVKKYGAPLIPDTPEEYEYGDYSVCSVCARGITFGHDGVWRHTHVLPESMRNHKAAPQGMPEEPSFEGTVSEVQIQDFPKHGSEGTCANCGKRIRYIEYVQDGQETGMWIHRGSIVGPPNCCEAVFGGPAYPQC